MTGVYWYIWFLGPCWQFFTIERTWANAERSSLHQSPTATFSAIATGWLRAACFSELVHIFFFFFFQIRNLILKSFHCSTAFGLVTNLSDVISWAIFGWKTNKRGERTQPWGTRGKTSSACSLSPVETSLLWGRTQSSWGHERRLTSSHFARAKVFKSASN